MVSSLLINYGSDLIFTIDDYWSITNVREKIPQVGANNSE